ncbi:GCN5 family N-acetyltransferase [Kitasatospora herbaricolor]|uniref:GNAT family N-acetyltransferase n=1 Tax=Kitasatospora herbaricolor TaxID=68217 RepID=UPI00174D5848|nr:GNAT family protein [Kitasatospora herbaricolor]MDQ0313108.1 RimJ/RimL family protein N-acetyltransferase [Kitasatospora herbaricolor]GGV39964.1 GCN5 family N-acetyltransferase [Kitasatospora herbaricolor]
MVTIDGESPTADAPTTAAPATTTAGPTAGCPAVDPEGRLRPVVLTGRHVRLEPLGHGHHDGLCEAVRDGDLWNLQVTLVPHPDDVGAFIDQALAAHRAGDQLAFATIDSATGKVAGSTRLMAVNLPFRRLEIGFTFLGRSWQRTAVNTEAKLLMLTHAFEELGLNRVEFLTDFRNSASRAAIARLGATQEGVLRSHMVMRDGWVRDSVLFSITAAEWPDSKRRLTAALAARAGGPAR